MPYIDSYIWNIRQKIGHDLLIIPSADTLAIDDNGNMLLVHNKDFNNWFLPGGYVEPGQSSAECAARELLEEGGLTVQPDALVPFAFTSGHTHTYANGDVTQPFTQFFIARKWVDNGEKLDTTEISRRKWFSFDELSQIGLNAYMTCVIEAYAAYAQTGRYQTIPSNRF